MYKSCQYCQLCFLFVFKMNSWICQCYFCLLDFLKPILAYKHVTQVYVHIWTHINGMKNEKKKYAVTTKFYLQPLYILINQWYKSLNRWPCMEFFPLPCTVCIKGEHPTSNRIICIFPTWCVQSKSIMTLILKIHCKLQGSWWVFYCV